MRPIGSCPTRLAAPVGKDDGAPRALPPDAPSGDLVRARIECPPGAGREISRAATPARRVRDRARSCDDFRLSHTGNAPDTRTDAKFTSGCNLTSIEKVHSHTSLAE